MPKGKFFYLFVAAAAMIFLVILAGIVFSKKPVKPTPVSPAATVQAPAAKAEKIVAEKMAVPEAIRPQPAQEAEKPVAETAEAPAAAVAPAATEERVTAPAQAPAAINREFQKGMILVAWTENGYRNPSAAGAMEQIVSLGTQWVSVVATWYQDKYDSARVYAIPDKTPSDESLISAIRKLHQLKLKVMLKPHLDLVEGDGKWRGDIGSDEPSFWPPWFESYAAFILRYAQIAAQENVELFCIGTELSRTALSQPERWRELIKRVQEIYKGQLTYAANWNNEFDKITFWDALDYAGIDPYFPLVTTMKPQVEELKSAWLDWIKALETWQAKINKPVIFAEIGYKSAKDATDEPWQYTAMGELDLELQSITYRALLESFWDKPWFYGVYWWYWGVNPRMGGPLNRGFTPQNKPAQEVIKEWYSKPVSGKAY